MDPCDACSDDVGEHVVEIEVCERAEGVFREMSFCTLCPRCADKFIELLKEMKAHGKDLN